MASKNLTETFQRCTAYNLLVQKAARMQQEMPSSALGVWENRWAAGAPPQTPLRELTVVSQTYS